MDRAIFSISKAARCAACRFLPCGRSIRLVPAIRCMEDLRWRLLKVVPNRRHCGLARLSPASSVVAWAALPARRRGLKSRRLWRNIRLQLAERAETRLALEL